MNNSCFSSKNLSREQLYVVSSTAGATHIFQRKLYTKVDYWFQLAIYSLLNWAERFIHILAASCGTWRLCMFIYYPVIIYEREYISKMNRLWQLGPSSTAYQWLLGSACLEYVQKEKQTIAKNKQKQKQTSNRKHVLLWNMFR